MYISVLCGFVAVSLLVGGEAGSGTSTPVASASLAASAGLPVSSALLSPQSPFRVPIAAGTPLHANSTAIVGQLTDAPPALHVLEFAVPVFGASATTLRVSVVCTMVAEEWGDCPLDDARVPVPGAAVPNTGSDAKMVIWDQSAGLVYEYWQAHKIAKRKWETSWGMVSPVGGDGTMRSGVGDGHSTGSGISTMAGLIRLAELRKGNIPHALMFASSKTCKNEFHYPAAKTDGMSEHPDCIPQGTRVQLDPAIDVAAIPGITPAEIAIARALQKYGAYAGDRSTSSFDLSLELARGANAVPGGNDNWYCDPNVPDIYCDSGVQWDYWDMPHIPWQSLRVLDPTANPQWP